MERLPNRYPKISQSHKVPLYKGLSLFYPKLRKVFEKLADSSRQIARLLGNARKTSKVVAIRCQGLSIVHKECFTL